MSRETPKTTPPLPTIPVGSIVAFDNGQAGTITTVRRRKWAKRYEVTLDNGQVVLVRRAEFKPS